MKKILIALIIIPVIALLAVPNLVGGGIQSATVDTLLTMIPDEASQVLDIRQTAFQRGWFSSDAQIEITIDELEELTGERVALMLDMDISHGPLLFTPQGIRLGLAYADIVPGISGIRPEDIEPNGEIQSSTPQAGMFAGFDSSVELHFDLENLSASNPEARLEISGLRGSSQILANLSSNASADLDSLIFAIENGVFDLTLDNAAFSGSEADITQPISTGQSSFVIDRVNSSAPIPLSLGGLTATYALSQNPADTSFLELTQQFRIEELDWDLPVNSLQWQFELSHLNRELLESYLALVQQTQQGAGTDPAEATARISALGQDLALDLIRDSFGFDNTIEINAFNGDHSLSLNIDWPGMAGVTDFQSLDIQQLLRTVRVQINLDADQSALMSSPFAQTVIDYERPGFLFIENGRVLSTIRLADGTLDINGQLTPLEQFINL